MKKEIEVILAHLGECAFGVTVVFMSSTMLEFMPTWVWQIMIGLALMMAGVVLFDSAPDLSWTPFEHVRGHTGWIEMLLGIIVFLNFARYDEIIAMTGSWPLYVCGGLLVFTGFLQLLRMAFADKPKETVTQ